jgi:hypothetical protein
VATGDPPTLSPGDDQSHLDGGPRRPLTHHRFWAQAEIATAFSLQVRLFG